MGLAKLIDLILSFLLANDTLSLVVSEALQDALMVQLHLLFLLLLLLQLQTNELILLLSDCSILDSLRLERLVLIFKLFDNLLELLDPLLIRLVLLLTSLILGRQLSVKFGLQLLEISIELIL